MIPTLENSARPPAHVVLMQMLGAGQIVGALATLAQLGIPDCFADGPKSAAEVAAMIDAKTDPVYRLMRATASVGVLTEGPDGKFSQTPLSALLCTNSKPCLRHLAAMAADEWHAQGWSLLGYCVRNDKQAADKMFGMPIFEYFAQHPERGKIFNLAMTDISSLQSPAIAAAYDFAGIHSIVDIAGGHGLLLATILEHNPHLRGTLFEMPHVVEDAKVGPLQPLMSRCAVASGDMFAAVPGSTDAYIMKHIIHDWPDAECIRLLQACRRGVNSNGKLLVVEAVILPGNEFSPGKFLDLQMLIFPGGRERTEKQFAALFAASGWKLSRVIPTASLDSIVEGVPA
jgi:O-methyltransferase domain